jgi:hypothetical protein
MSITYMKRFASGTRTYTYIGKGKGKDQPTKGHEGPEVE